MGALVFLLLPLPLPFPLPTPILTAHSHSHCPFPLPTPSGHLGASYNEPGPNTIAREREVMSVKIISFTFTMFPLHHRYFDILRR